MRLLFAMLLTNQLTLVLIVGAAHFDALLRVVGNALCASAPLSPASVLERAPEAISGALGSPLPYAERLQLAQMAHSLAKRLCVPRDMGKPAGEQLRAALQLAAHALRV
mmetsp:Transcript_1219/g.3234  ORF Transcript_1219/g.3234 Transcript_1219/m.3234 type:complete len:109 (-) Transcript_1219:52-378(-)